MPTITRWFNVSHDINADPEMWELREKFTDRAALIWLECLSIADRNSGVVGPASDHTRNQLASKCRTSRAKVESVLSWCRAKGWLRFGQDIQVTNWSKYNKLRVAKKLPSEPSEPSEPTKPIQPRKNKNKRRDACIAYSLDFERCWKINGYGSKLKAWEAWQKAGCHAVTDIRDAVLRGLAVETDWRRQAETYRRDFDSRFFIPEPAHLSTWINQRRWEQKLRPIPENGHFSEADQNIRRILTRGLDK